jgi:DNA-binding PadR family transcriptional regulator
MRYNDDDTHGTPGRGHRRGGRRRPGFGEAVGPGFVQRDFGPEDADDDQRPRSRAGGRGGRGPGSGPGFGHGFGPGAGFGPGGHRGRRGRGRPRGDVRAAILLLLEEGPRHGYQLIQEIAERSGGAWTPSAGSIYPTLQVLEDEGLVTIEPVDGRKTASLTEAGGTYVNENRDRLGIPWQQPEGEGGETVFALREAMIGLAEAAKQVFRVGTADQQQRAAQTLTDARTALYRILAEDGSAD